MQKHTEGLFYIGTYTTGENEGIYAFRLDGASGELQFTGHTASSRNPSFLAIHPSGRTLCAVNEMGQFEGKPVGGVSAFAIDRATGALSRLNQQPSHGAGPCYVAMDQTGRHALVANYSAGSVAIFPIGEDGRLGEATHVVQHLGSGSDPRRQKGPHAHSINVDPTNRFALAADLGLDRVFVYQLDLVEGKLLPNVEPWVELKPGAGPRHFAFNPKGTHAYVINELDSTMAAFAYHRTSGRLTHLQTLSTLPEGFAEVSYCADVHVAPSGEFLYGSNRGHDSIVIYRISPTSGEMTLVGFEPTQGKNPRNFAIDPTGAFLLAANQDSHTVVVFRIDAETGKLTPTGHTASVPKPVCVQFMPS